MTNTLDDLFDQIIHSERKAQERKYYLQEVKSQVSSLVEELAESDDELKRLKGQLLLKVQHWKDQEVEIMFLTSRRNILQEQKESLEAEKEQMTADLNGIQADLHKTMSEFSSSVEVFSQGYDLVSSGSVLRAQDTRKQAELMEATHQDLAEDMNKYEIKRSAVEELEKELEIARNVLKETKLRRIGLEKEILASNIESLEREKAQVASLPLTGEEFKILHRELESVQSDSLEAKCSELQSVLNSLHQRVRNNMLQEQQKMRNTSIQGACHTYLESTANKVCVTNFAKSNMIQSDNISATINEDDCVDFIHEHFDDEMNL